ncbi:MAG: hypothetical protein AB8B79_19125 [Granulosicoccus sp.]
MTILKISLYSLSVVGLVVAAHTGIERLDENSQPENRNVGVSKTDSMMIDSGATTEDNHDGQKHEILYEELSRSQSSTLPSDSIESGSNDSGNVDTELLKATPSDTPGVQRNPFGNIANAGRNVVDTGLIVVQQDPVRNPAADNSDNPFSRQADTDITENLLDVALLDPDYESESNEIATITFTHTPMSGVHHVNFPTVVGQAEAVYAHLLIAARCDDCIVRVQHYRSQEITSLAMLDLESGKPRTIYITPEIGWRAGEYILELHDPNRAKHLVGRNSMLISSVMQENQVNIPNTDYINYLVANGLATHKQR